MSAYLQDISVLTSLQVVADSVLVVAYGALVTPDPASMSAYDSASTMWINLMPETRYIDVYINSRRVATALPVPGEIVGSTRSGLLVLVKGESGETERLVEYRWRPG